MHGFQCEPIMQKNGCVVEWNAFEKEFCEIRGLMPDNKSLIKGLFGRKGKEWRKGRQR